MLLVAIFGPYLWAWQVYDRDILPHVPPRVARPNTPTAIRLDDPAAVRRHQRVSEYLGQAATYREAKRQDWANEALERAIAIDPTNSEALALKVRWQIEPAPTFTPEEAQERLREQQARLREAQTVDLLGAAASFVDSGEPALAIPLLQEVLRLDPENITAKATLQRLAP